MLFEQFLKQAAPKIGPNGTFDLARDARLTALENLLLAKGIFSRAELDHSQSIEFEKSARTVEQMVNAPGSPFKRV